VVKPFVFAVPGDLATPTGGYAYDRRMIAELAKTGWHAEVLDLGSNFPRPRPAARATATERLAAIPAGAIVVIDGLALGVLPEAAAALGKTHRPVALVHHPLALETGLSLHEAEILRRSERAALAPMRHVIVTSATTARVLAADYAVPPERISIAVPGVERGGRAARPDGDTVALLAVGALVPRKGYDVLLTALAAIADLPWRLTIVGPRDRNVDYASSIEAMVAALGLGHRVSLSGAVAPERLAALYAATDLFVLASRYEGYGMAFTEAIAHGIPVVGTTAGAIPEAVPAGAGVLVPPDDAAALSRTLRPLLADHAAREALAAGAQAQAARLPTWAQSAAAFAAALETLVPPI
jgi:glycosyltransferase involved in cell wall biosynthesis